MQARRKEYLGQQSLLDMRVGESMEVALPSYNKVVSAKVTANILKNKELGEWSIRLITNRVIGITRNK